MTRHFLSLSDAGPDGVAAILADALDRKAARGGLPKGAADADAPLAGHTLAMVFEKSSTRTRVSFDMAIRQLGGSALVLDSATTQLGRGETVADTARILSGYCDAIMLRTDEHAKLLEMAQYASVPVVNGLTDVSHPCQIMADLMTLLEAGKALPGLKVAWLGDGNNVLYSLMEAATILRFQVVAACPTDYELDVSAQLKLRALKLGLAGDMRRVGNRWSELPASNFTTDPREAVAGADVVVTDTWISMGQAHAETKLAALAPYQVTPELMAAARADAVFLHCLPAHRGEEVAAEVIDGPQSLIWPEAENRLHAQKSILRWCFGQIG